MTKYILTLFSLLVFLVPTIASANEDVNPRREQIKEIREDIREDRKNLRETIVDKARALFPRAAIGKGTLTKIDGSLLEVTKDGKTYVVKTGQFDKCTTKFVRRFGGESTLSEFTVGDSLSVVGRFTDDTKATVEACVVRNLSIQKRFAVFVGEVKSLGASTIVMSTKSNSREDQTVSIDTSTKFVNNKGQTVSREDVKVGHRIKVRGLWNRLNNTVTQVEYVKDYSI